MSGQSIYFDIESSRASWQQGLLLIVVLLVVAIVYWPGLGGGFAFDDYSNIVFNSRLHVTELDWDQWISATFSSPAKELPRPLAMLSFGINHFLTGLDPWPMKATNLAIHLINTALVYLLMRSLMRSAWQTAEPVASARIALYVAGVWAALPINFMAVLLVVQRMEILSHTFVFLGLWLYLMGRQRQTQGVGGGWGPILTGLLFCTALGALSKESAVLLPLYAFALEVFVLGFRGSTPARSNALITLYLLILLIPAIAAVAWLLPPALDPGSFAFRNFSLGERLLTEPHVVADYLRWTLFPDLSQLSLFHDDFPVSRGLLSPPATLISLIALSLVAVVAWKLRRIRPLTSLGISWFFGAQLLTATFIPLELMFEHRNYFASVGISLLLADVLLIAPSGSRYRQVAATAALMLLAFYVGTCHLRAREWSDPVRFAQTEAAKHPQSPRATYNYAHTLAILSNGRGDSPFTALAFAEYERAGRVPESGITAAQGALLLAARTGKPMKSEWWEQIQSRLARRPIGPQELGAMGSLSNCAISGRCKFPPREMLAMFAAALSRGDHPEVLNIYGNYALNVLGDQPLAERLWRGAHDLNPQEPEYVIGLAKLAIAMHRTKEAEELIRHLRSMGRLGQHERSAKSLELRLAASQDASGDASGDANR